MNRYYQQSQTPEPPEIIAVTTCVPASIYRGRPAAVKLSGIRNLPSLVVAALAALALVAAGCASTTVSGAVPRYLITMRYDVEPVFVEKARSEAISEIRRDLQFVAELGFDTVLLQHLDDDERGLLVDIAERQGLRVAVSSRRLRRLSRADEAGVSGETLQGLFEGVATEMAVHPTTLLLVDSSPVAMSAAWIAGLCRLVCDRGSACVTVGSAVDRPLVAALAGIDARTPDHNRGSSPMEQWLTQFHRGLIAGRTGGLVVDRYRRPVGDPPGLMVPGEPLSPARAAAAKELTARARAWGTRLCGAAVVAMEFEFEHLPGLQAAAFSRGRRRYLLVFNSSATRWVRAKMELPDSIGGTPVRRAVAVPPSSVKLPGQVVDAAGGRLVVRLELRPGDASLYEIF